MAANLGLNERQAVILTVGFYMVTALIMVSVNKWALNTFEAPWTLLWLQMAIAVGLLKATHHSGLLKMPEIKADVSKALLPLIAINVIGLGVNTLCLVYVDTSFYQIARGLVLPFTVIFAYTLLGQPSSGLVIAACFTVFCGFYTGVTSELNVSQIGVIFGVISSITTSLHAIVIKKSLGAVNNSSIDLVYYNNVLSLVATTPIIFLSGESATISETLAAEGFEAFHSFLFAAFITGIFGFLINLAGFMQISKTSPTTHMISGAVRGVLQTLLGHFAFKDVITSGRLIGIVLILSGSALYTYAKDKEMRASTKPTYIPMTQQDVDEDDKRSKSRD
ncbi:hypothetical protein CPC16_009036 [Podila verticillata]|nr:hypothetical protein BGZ59_007475 [Podila verticillata]KAF9383188.1 hypothetical protein CPC16_009036 [Podila verticillata]KAI9234367.1 MAG: hypothetical protein BYD32DRAFT_90639 [Podila humilis]KFH68743.1 hypothetical protein MVEG_05550 [Podila verticillata NRRL 6337]